MNLSTRVHNDADPSAISIDEARERIKSRLSPHTPSEQISCADALGRIVAHDVESPLSVPPFRASAMDGFAVRAAECHAPLVIKGQSLAGHPGNDVLEDFSCQRITTGARVPDQADTVVQQENTERRGDTLIVTHQPTTGLHVRLPGSDSQQGTVLIEAGTRVGAAQIALLCAHGIDTLDVLAPLVIALFSTGDELQTSGKSLLPGQIYDANRPLLQALLGSSAVTIIDLGICKDTESDVHAMLQSAAAAHIIVSSGGVSVGDADFVRPVLEKQGRVDLWKIAMKPGRPLTFGFSATDQAFFGLPGNPVSAAITALHFIRPAIRHMLGMPPSMSPPLHLPLRGSLSKNPGRVEYQRAIMACDDDENWWVSTTGMQDSHVLSSLHKANCLIELPIESTGAESGETVRVLPFSHFAEDAL